MGNTVNLEIGMLRIRQDGPVFRVDEIVTLDGLYITWGECFASKESARDFLSARKYKTDETTETKESGNE